MLDEDPPLQCEILDLWPTPVQLGLLRASQAERSSEYESLGKQSLLVPFSAHKRLWAEQFLSYLRSLGEQAPQPDRLRFDLLEHRASGYAGMRWFSGTAQGLLVLEASIRSPRVRQSGRLFLYDPRIGSGTVFAPGLPFGRPMVLDLEPGLSVFFPSFLRASFAPMEADDWVVAARMSTE
jgi:hypothetical protein